MTQRIQAEEEEFFKKRAKDVEDHVKANPKLIDAIKRAHKTDRKELVPAKEYFEKNGGTNL